LGCVKLHTDYYKDKSLKGLSLVWRNDENLKTHTVDYRFGFNGMEQDNEVSGSGNSYDFGARIYDSRLGRWMSTDPWEYKYAWQSSYAYFKNSTISTLNVLGMGGGDETEKGKPVEKSEGPSSYANRHNMNLKELALANPDNFTGNIETENIEEH
jgi:RHS repeat-associated protein